MYTSRASQVMYGLVIVGVSLSLSACNTTKATIDSTIKFFSSTSPDSLFTGDGMVEQSQKAKLFSGVAYENLRQDVAHGSGQYLTSLAVLLNIPPGKHAEFGTFIQSRYPVLFTSDLSADPTAHVKMLAALDRELQMNANLRSMF